MTVTYTFEVATCRGLGCFWKLLFRWKGSIYKLMWPDLLAYTVIYFSLTVIYRFLLSQGQKGTFENISSYCEKFSNLIPIAFVLGFYVSIVVQRWMKQFELLPWPDNLALFVSTNIPENDNRGRLMRRTIMRYANLASTLTFRMICPRVKLRFPTLDHLVEAGFLMSNEKEILEDITKKCIYPVFWLPLVWAGAIVSRCRKEGRIKDDFAVKSIMDEIKALRGLNGTLLAMDWLSVPLVYTQVVTLAVYTYFIATLMGSQFVRSSDIDIYFPIFTYLQFFFYMGWLKVAESLINPFGDDDDDFEMNFIIDRNLQLSYMIVDEMHNDHPDLIKDIYWDEVFPQEFPYTPAAQELRKNPFFGSTANLELPHRKQSFLPFVEEKADEQSLSEKDENGIKIMNRSTRERHSVGPSSLTSKPSVLSLFKNKFMLGSQIIHSGSPPTPARQPLLSRRSVSFKRSVSTTSKVRSDDEDIFQMSDLDISEKEDGPDSPLEKLLKSTPMSLIDEEKSSFSLSVDDEGEKRNLNEDEDIEAGHSIPNEKIEPNET